MTGGDDDNLLVRIFRSFQAELWIFGILGAVVLLIVLIRWLVGP